ncbi:MAG TPA: D-aminoacyl-tRNA deacylase, partial [Dehalococcoidia bacterium]|nr:D-aminoacyl-tRNA deacylase [Dehalococcoidia bacterium]
MRAVIQRVASASVAVDDTTVARIGRGVLVLVGIARGDTEREASSLARKIADLRIFPDDDGRFDRSLLDIG